MSYFRILAVALCLLGMQAASYAIDIQTVRIVASAGNAFSSDMALQLASLLKRPEYMLGVELVAAADIDPADSKALVVAIGERAGREISAVSTARFPLLLVAPQRFALNWLANGEKTRDARNDGPAALLVSGIQYEQPLPRLLNLASLIDVKNRRDPVKTLGVLVSPELQKNLTGLEKETASRQMKLSIQLVDSELGVGRAVARLVDESSILLAIPDPLVHTSNTVEPILLLTYRAGVPVIACSLAYLRAGATLALYSTPEQIALQAAETIAAIRAGKPVPALQVPRYFSVEENATVARSLGIDLAPASVLEAQLRAMKE